MKKEFNKQYIIDNKNCYTLEQVEKLSFINNNIITINDIFKSEISVKDKVLFLIENCNLTYNQKTDLSYKLACIVFPIFEEKMRNDKKVKECLQAIQLFKNQKITKGELVTKHLKAQIYNNYAVYATTYAAYALICITDLASVSYSVEAAAQAATDADFDTKSYIKKIKNKITKKKSYNELIIEAIINFCKTID